MIEKLTVDRILKMLECTPEQCLFDWKRDLAYDTEDKKSEVVKDVVAIANAAGDGPGYVFYGVDPDHPDRILGMTDSYDDSRFQQLVKGKVDPLPEFLFYPLTHEGKSVGVMHVAQSSHRPHIITCDFGKLRAGQIVIRRGSSTAGVTPLDLQEMFYGQSSPFLPEIVKRGIESFWPDIVKRGVEALVQPAAAVEHGTKPSTAAATQHLAELSDQEPPARYVSDFVGRVGRHKRRAWELMKEQNIVEGTYSAWYAPETPVQGRPLNELRSALEKARRPHSGHPMGMLQYGDREAQPTDAGISFWHTHWDALFEYWYLDKGGGFLLLRDYDEYAIQTIRQLEPRRIVAWSTRIWHIGEVVEHCLALYEALGVEPSTRLRLEMVHGDLKGRKLSNLDTRKAWFYDRDTQIRKVASRWAGALGELRDNKKAVVRRFLDELLEKFEFFELGEEPFEKAYGEFLASKAR